MTYAVPPFIYSIYYRTSLIAPVDMPFSTSRPPLALFASRGTGLAGYQVLVGKHNGLVELVRQATVTATQHEGADDKLAERVEFTAQRDVEARVSEAETDITAGRMRWREHEDIEGGWFVDSLS